LLRGLREGQSSTSRPKYASQRLLAMSTLFGFTGGPQRATAARRITPALVRLRDRFDRAGAPVIHVNDNFAQWRGEFRELVASCIDAGGIPAEIATRLAPQPRSEEHTSELQSRENLVCRLLLE